MSTELKKNKPKYKYGERYLDLNKYILNLDKNFQSYLNSRNWNDALKQEFINAFGLFLQAFKDLATNNTDRFYTNYAGSIFDKEGVFTNNDSAEVGTDYYNRRGKLISTDEYNGLKDRKKKKYNTFNANREVATYFNRIAQSMPTLEENEETPTTKAFNIRNNGFLKWWNDQINPSGSLIDNTPYLNMDELNSDNTRGTTKRAEYLRLQLLDYINQLGEYNFDSTTFKSRDNYILKLLDAITKLLNGYNSEALIALRAAGIGDEFTTAFFSTGEKKESPDSKLLELAQKEEEIKKLKELKDLDDKLYNLKRNEFFSSIPLLDKPITGDITTFSEYENDEARKAGIEGTLNALLKYHNLQNLSTNDQQIELKRILESKFPYIVGELRKGNAKGVTPYLKALHAIGSFGTPDNNGYVILPNSVDLNRKSYIAYNPILGKYEERLLDLSKELLQKMAFDTYDSLNKVSKKLIGGSIESLGLEFWNLKKAKEAENNAIFKEVKETGKSEKEVRAEKRKPSEELSGVDITRLTTAGMDIAAMISSFIPGYGTVTSAGLGLGSTIGNIGADIADDSMSTWDTTKNALFGLGMDVLGLIPGWGASAKTTKIVQILKPVVKTALAIMSGIGMVTSANAFAKMISNPSEMTVADWRDALAGIKAITGAARSKGTTVSRNRELARNLVASNYVDVPVKSGKSIKMSEELFNKLKKAKGIEEQNKILKEVAPNEELGTEFISGTFSHLRHPLHRNPDIERGTDYAQMDWSLREYLPTGYTYDAVSGLVVPKKRSNAWLMNKVDRMVSSDSEDNSFGFFREKNPLYNNNSQSTPQPTRKSNSLLSKKRFDKAVDDLVYRKTIEYWKKRFPKRLAGKSDEEIWNIVQQLAIASRKSGGTILIFLEGKKFRNNEYLKVEDTEENANNTSLWDKYYNFDKMFNNLSTIENLNATKLVGILNELSNILRADKLQFSLQAAEGYSRWNKKFNETGFNDFFGYSQDKEDWLGPTTYNRLALITYLLNKEEPIDINGTKIKFNADSKSWELVSPEVKPNEATKPETTEKPDEVIEPGNSTEKQGNGTWVDGSGNNSDLPEWAKGYKNPLNNTLLYGLPRAIAADIINRRMTLMSIDNERPFLRDPLEFHRSIIGDIDALFRGLKSYANVRNFANKMTTSDADLLKATLLEGELKGQEYLLQGAALNNAQLRASSEQAWQLEKENTNNRWNTAMQNRLSMLLTLSNIYKYRLAEMAKSFDNWDRFWLLMEYDAKQKEQEKKQYTDYFKKRDIQNDIANNLANLDKSVSPEGAKLYKQVKQGLLNPSSITDANELSEFRKAFVAALKLEEDALKKYYGVYKKGGKVDIDRFQEQILKSIDRNEKLLDRLSKSLYGYIKLLLK